MKKSHLLWIGAALVVGYLVYTKYSATPTTPAATTPGGTAIA